MYKISLKNLVDLFAVYLVLVFLLNFVQAKTNNRYTEKEIKKVVDDLKQDFFKQSLNFSLVLNQSSYSNDDYLSIELNNMEKQTIEASLHRFQLDLLKKRNFICLHDLHDEFDWEHIKLENLSFNFNEMSIFEASNISLPTILKNKVKKYFFFIFLHQQ